MQHLIRLGGETGYAQAVVNDEIANHAALLHRHVFGQDRRIPIPAIAVRLPIR